MSRLALVVIGRNEGLRLARSLDSVSGLGVRVVYVDSGSTDGSSELARRRGATVVQLDPSTPFTAGRARNEGARRVLALHPDVDFVQFVDGDCEVVAGWLEAGCRALENAPRTAAVCGRVREANRDQTIYNRLCDLEWEARPGETASCGGNAMMRVAPFRDAGGFDPRLIAGEEPELCLRLRRSGWTVVRCDRDMVLHDAAMTSFGQWWRRALRAGWAFAEGAALHGDGPERHWVHESRSILFWGAGVPAAMLLAALPTAGLSFTLAAGYGVLGARIYRAARRNGTAASDARLQAAFTVIAKFPQAIGQVQYAAFRLLRKRRRIVDWRVMG
jgi:GT2 family glycosyltransferase